MGINFGSFLTEKLFGDYFALILAGYSNSQNALMRDLLFRHILECLIFLGIGLDTMLSL